MARESGRDAFAVQIECPQILKASRHNPPQNIINKHRRIHTHTHTQERLDVLHVLALFT